MKILILTQVVDDNDSVLGFFHAWLKEFSVHFEHIVAVCLLKGEVNLPGNVTVFSLGKEKRHSRIHYIFNFYKYIWREHKNYDAVFVHMNQEYVLLGGIMWKLMGEKVYMWRNHHSGNFITDSAAFFCTHVFCTSKFSYTAKYKKTIFMPVGIDTGTFKPDASSAPVPRSILFLARITPAKCPDVLIEALGILKNKGIEFSAAIYGDALPKDMEYYKQIKQRASSLGLDDHLGRSRLTFYPGIPNRETPKIYSSNDIFVNNSSSGMYDKTIFEAMASGALVLASNENLRGVIDDCFIFTQKDAHELSQKILTLLELPVTAKNTYRAQFRKLVENQHSLKMLGAKLSSVMSGNILL